MGVIIQALKVGANSITSYNKYEGFDNSRGLSVNSRENLKKNRFNGTISNTTRNKIGGIIENMHLSMNFTDLKDSVLHKKELKKITFTTLTLSQPQKHDDAYIKRYMFSLFIKKMRSYGHFKTYVWRAESQQNGNIHFHIVSNEYIDKENIQDVWNQTQEIHGYLEDYGNKYGHTNAPSTQIVYSLNLEQTACYISKYVSKNEGNRIITGRIWGCSDNLKEVKSLTAILDFRVEKVINHCVSTGELEVYANEHCRVFSGNIVKMMVDYLPYLFKEFKENANVNSRLIAGLPGQISDKILGKTTIRESINLSKSEEKHALRRKSGILLKSQIKINF